MSSCTLSYLNKTNLPLSEKERLTELHNQIFEELKQSKYLRKYKGQLVMPKHGYDVRWASADIKRVNERYGDKVVSVIYDRSDKYFKAMVDVLKTIVTITNEDKIIFGHPTIGKSYLKHRGDNRFITLDDDYASEVNSFVDANRGNETRQEYKGRKPKEYNNFMLNLYEKLKVQAKKEGKILFVSNTNILKERISDFDKVITMPKDEFKKRFDARGATYGFEDWKSEIDTTIAKVPVNKVINTTKYLSELLPNKNSNPNIDITMQAGNQYFAGGEVFPTYEDAQSFKEKVEQEYVQMEINRLFEAGELQIDCDI